MNAWLIECEPPLGDTLYFCNDGDWCSNPNHAYKFATAEEANAKRTTMQLGERFRVTEHEWAGNEVSDIREALIWMAQGEVRATEYGISRIGREAADEIKALESRLGELLEKHQRWALKIVGYLDDGAEAADLRPMLMLLSNDCEPEVRCRACGGNDRHLPCAYPSEGVEHCLRDKRLVVETPGHIGDREVMEAKARRGLEAAKKAARIPLTGGDTP